MFNNVVKKKVKRRKRYIDYKNWWDISCSKKKREVKRICRKWKNGKEIFGEEESSENY